MYKTVIFDLDGTLLNTIDDLGDAANWVCRQNGWPTHTIQQYKTFVGNGIPKLVERFTPPDRRDPHTLETALAQFQHRYDAHKEDKTAPYPGIADLLDTLALARVTVGVLSNKDDDLARQVILAYFGQRIPYVQGRQGGIPPKPDPAGLYQLMERMQADPADTLFVGDSDVDIATGHNGRLPAAGVLWGFRTLEELRRAGAEYIVDTPQALAEIILGDHRQG